MRQPCHLVAAPLSDYSAKLASAFLARLAGSPMRRLLLLRHAKTETDAASGRDFDRKLDPRGLADAEQIGRWLVQNDHAPRRALFSSAVRARQTWDIVASTLAAAPEAIELAELYNATPTYLMQAIRDCGDDATPLMVVAHNPGLHEVALALAGSGDAAAIRALNDNLPTSGLVILDFDLPLWRDAGFRRGHLVAIVSPKTLRGSADEAG